MKTKRCKRCGAVVRSNGKYCPNCGGELIKQKKRHPILGIVFLAFSLILIYNLFNTETSNTTPQTTQVPKYDAEIKYKDIDWGSNAIEVIGNDIRFLYEGISPSWEDTEDYPPVSSVVAGYVYCEFPEELIGGYPIRQRNTYYLYGHDDSNQLVTDVEESEFYLAYIILDITNVNGAYNDLLNKLTEIYGEGTTKTKVISTYSTAAGYYKSDLTITEWQGKNDTGVRLVCSVPHDDAPAEADLTHLYCALAYGKTDSKTTTQIIYKEYKQLLTERESENTNPEDKDGL